MEYFDLYNKDRVKTNIVIKRGDKVPSGLYRLVVHICFFNDQDQMLIQKRSSSKKNWPSLWDISVGGCVTEGEDSNIAAYREVKEEIGIEVDFSNKRPIFTFNFNEGFDDIYIVNQNIDLASLTLQSEEVEDVKWATCDEILKMMKNGEFIIYQESFIKLLFEIRHSNDIYME